MSYYSILVRWGPEWDGQSVIYTSSEALFEALKAGENVTFTEGFSEKLKQAITAVYNKFEYDSPYPVEPINQDMDLLEAIEYLESCVVKYPITILDHTEFTPWWNR